MGHKQQGRIQNFNIEGAQEMCSAHHNESEARNPIHLADVHDRKGT